MANHSYSDPISVCFNILKLRYVDYDNSLTNLNILKPNDKVNVFINMETAFKHLSMIPESENKLVLQRDFEEILISNILDYKGLSNDLKKECVDKVFEDKTYEREKEKRELYQQILEMQKTMNELLIKVSSL